MIERFSAVKRASHWAMALSFVALAVTGLVTTFGKAVLLPLIGYTLFSWLATISMLVHNFTGPLFAVAVPVFIVLFIRDNLPKAYDVQWLAKFGGMLDRSGASTCPPASSTPARSSPFWLMVCVLSVVVTSPASSSCSRTSIRPASTMQLANVIHMVAAIRRRSRWLCAHLSGHDRYARCVRAMRDGYVDETWARAPRYWYDDVVAGQVDRGAAPRRARRGPDAAD